MVNDEWLTPLEIINACGEFDLDPCSPIKRPWDTAKHHYCINDDGLRQLWFGRVWCNPPYGKYTAQWIEKLSVHGNGIALIFARTETEMFFKYVWEKASSILFIKGRLYFYSVEGVKAAANSGAPSCLVAYGDDNTAALDYSGISGKLICL
jgi:hypothetical protein